MRSVVLLARVVPVTSTFAFQIGADPLTEARAELFAARYTKAAELYSALIAREATNPEAYYGVVRALIAAHRATEAYSYAEQALQRAPQTAGAEDAAGMAMFRKGDLVGAESHFRSALKLKSNDARALFGMSSILSTVSKYKTARDLALKAYSLSPDDPSFMRAYADSLEGPKHIEAIERLLASLDPGSDEARILRVHISVDRSASGRELRRLTSTYESTKIKLFRIMNGPTRQRGVGLHVQFNQGQSFRLILDTSISGISLAPKAAKQAGLQVLDTEGFEAKGLGDERVDTAFEYLASEVRVGSVTFADYPITVLREAKTANYDGAIGMQAFRQFIVGIDIPELELSLDARLGGPSAQREPTDASDTIPVGFVRMFSFNGFPALPTSINGKPPVFFTILAGSNFNAIDSAAARESSQVYRDNHALITGVQGKVAQVDRVNDISLAFAGFRQENLNLAAIDLVKRSDQAGVDLAGSLGLPALDHMKLTFDYREGILRMEYKQWALAH
jgi:tetratricopeptide (TPR) repeat protein